MYTYLELPRTSIFQQIITHMYRVPNMIRNKTVIILSKELLFRLNDLLLMNELFSKFVHTKYNSIISFKQNNIISFMQNSIISFKRNSIITEKNGMDRCLYRTFTTIRLEAGFVTLVDAGISLERIKTS